MSLQICGTLKAYSVLLYHCVAAAQTDQNRSKHTTYVECTLPPCTLKPLPYCGTGVD